METVLGYKLLDGLFPRHLLIIYIYTNKSYVTKTFQAELSFQDLYSYN